MADITPLGKFDKDMKSIIDVFVNASEANLYVVPFVTIVLLGLVAKIINLDVKNFLEQHGHKIAQKDAAVEYEIDLLHIGDLDAIMDRFYSANFTLRSYTKSIIIQLSTQFDILMAGIVGQIVALKPSVLDVSDRKIHFIEIKKFEDIGSLRQHFIDKTIETVVRKSRSEQFMWLSDKLGIHLTKDLEGWSEFIEINERRNLFTHTEGRVTKEYVENCVAAGHKRDRLGNIGDELKVEKNYLIRANELFFVIGVKLVQVVWRKLTEDSKHTLDQADSSLIDVIYELNRSQKYAISAEVGRFACGEVLKKYSSERNKRILYINFAASLNLLEKQRDAQKILGQLEWDASSIEFQLAVAAIRDETSLVCELMPKAEKSGAIGKKKLQEWPLFFRVRDKEEFRKTYKTVFSEDYVAISAAKSIETKQRQEILDQMRSFSGSNIEDLGAEDVVNSTKH